MTVRRKIPVSSAVLLAVLFTLLLWFVPLRTARFDGPTEQSKAWSNVLKAAQSVQTVQSIRGAGYAYGDLTPDGARIFVETNRVLLATARMELQQELLVPVIASREWLLAHENDMATMKRLVHAILTEGKVAEADGQTDEAVVIYLDGLTLSYNVVRGGIGFDYLNGLSYKALVLRAIEDLVPKLNDQQCQRILVKLDKFESEQEPLSSIASRDRAWRRKVFGLNIRSTVTAMVKTRSLYPELNPRMRAAFNQSVTSARKRLIDAIETKSSP